MKAFATLITLFLIPFSIWALREFTKPEHRGLFPRGLTIAWCAYTIGGAAMILFLVWGAALDTKLQ